jgi:hypothetical protein
MDKYKGVLTNLNPDVMATVKSEIQKNYAKAEIFFQTLNVVNISQSPMLDVTNVLFSFFMTEQLEIKCNIFILKKKESSLELLNGTKTVMPIRLNFVISEQLSAVVELVQQSLFLIVGPTFIFINLLPT